MISYKKYNFEVIILFFLLFIFIISFPLYAIGVQPLVLDLEVSQGETQQFELKLSPEQNQSTAELNLYYPRQQLTGSLSYEEGNLDEHPVLNWLDLPDEVIVPPGEETSVDVQVSVPYGVEGTHTAIIMVEPKVEEAEKGITFQVRYAVRVNIHVDAPGLREEAEVKSFKLESTEENQPLIQTHIKNPSPLSYNAAGEVTIRDQNRRLIERVPIRSEHASQGGRDETTIYPGSEVIFSGKVTEPLAEGTYDLQLFLYYADGRQVIERKTIDVGDEFIDYENLEYIEVKPEVIDEELRRGGAHTEALDIRNRLADPLNIKIAAQKNNSDYKHSLLNNFQIELRGGQEFELEGRRSKRPVLIVRAPREEIEDGGYYDTLQIGVFDPETEEQLEIRDVDLSFIVGEDYEYSGEIKTISTQRVEDEILFSTIVENTGDAHFSPRARIYLKKDGEIKYTLFTELAEEDDEILPEMKGILSSYANVEAGEYTADITLQYKGEEIERKELPVEIEAKKENKKD
ncbi:MAG: hypothetical protein ACQEQD_08750 [Bacillota bacterium]